MKLSDKGSTPLSHGDKKSFENTKDLKAANNPSAEEILKKFENYSCILDALELLKSTLSECETDEELKIIANFYIAHIAEAARLSHSGTASPFARCTKEFDHEDYNDDVLDLNISGTPKIDGCIQIFQIFTGKRLSKLTLAHAILVNDYSWIRQQFARITNYRLWLHVLSLCKFLTPHHAWAQYVCGGARERELCRSAFYKTRNIDILRCCQHMQLPMYQVHLDYLSKYSVYYN